MLIEILENDLFRKLNYKICDARAKSTVRQIKNYLHNGDKILDIGAGTCNVSEILREKDFDVTSLDIKNSSLVNNIIPVIYDGYTIPFRKKIFDVALLLTVLHHTQNPFRVLEEAKRVAKRLVIIEDVYQNSFHKYITNYLDSLINLELNNHPHSNKTDAEWKNIFKNLGFEILDAQQNRCFFVITQKIYYLCQLNK